MKNLRVATVVASALCAFFLLARGGAEVKSKAANSTTTPQGMQPCTDAERATFAQMSGSFHSYRMNVTIGGSCEQATGTFRVAEWCEGVDETYNKATPRVTGTFKGRMIGGSLTLEWEQPASPNHPAAKGTGSCSLNGDGKTFSCSGFGCRENKFKLQGPAAAQPPITTNPVQPPVATNPTRATVQGIKGDVSVSFGGGTFQDLTATGRQLQGGDEISTGPDAEATLVFADGSTVRLEPNTQITLATLNAQRNDIRVRMNLRFGKIAAKVNKERTAQSDYSVRTPTATTSIRGTAFSVRYDQQMQMTTVSVEEGTVQVTPENGSLRAVAVSAGQQVQVSSTEIGRVTGGTATNSGAGNTTGIESSFESITFEHNANWNGQKGMLIHVKFSVAHLQGVPCSTVAYFYYDDPNDTPLQTTDPYYKTPNGAMAYSLDFTPNYERTTFTDNQLFIRYSAFWLPRGTQNLKFRIQLLNKQTKEFFATSEWQRFQLVQK